MVLTYDAYSETLESEKQKEDKLASIEERFNNMQLMIEKLIAVSTQYRINNNLMFWHNHCLRQVC